MSHNLSAMAFLHAVRRAALSQRQASCWLQFLEAKVLAHSGLCEERLDA
jgi:hypothetical protein